MFESLVNQQIHPLSFFLLYHSPSFSPSHPIASFSPSCSCLTTRVLSEAVAKNTPGTEQGKRGRKKNKNGAGELRVQYSDTDYVDG